MEPNKIENQFKKQLNSREIMPSETTWNKLDSMLSDSEKPKRKFTWLYIAASFVGFLLIGTAYFNLNENTIENLENEVVFQQSISAKSSKKTLNSISENSENRDAAVVQKVVVKNINNSVLHQDSLTNKNILNQNSVAEVSIINHYKVIDTMIVSSKKNNYQSISTNNYVFAEKLLAEVNKSKFESKGTDMTTEKTIKSISVDPNSLLSDVESEVNQSFRESALDKLNTIKTVLVNRNLEK